ncbi:MAG: GNAT family N-acetyltransferase [Chloroflexi bacterium]|nr:GNAT family N-acetyltransferase [Chloroflexota bacterium]
MTSLKVGLPGMKVALALTQLPRDLGGDLVLRTATLDDTEPLAQFCGRVFGRDQFDSIAAEFSRAYITLHPAVGAANVLIVEDTRARKIVSTMLLIPQTWTYAGIPFGVGRVEMVATDPDHRRRGLVRAQFDALHAISAAMGHQVQGITGIYWFYRQFEYEYALDLGGGKMITFDAIPARKENETEPYRLRGLTYADIAFAQSLYARDCARSLIACPRAEADWRYLLDISPDSYVQCPYNILENADGRAVGYIATARELGMGAWYGAFEIALIEGQSLRATMPPILRALAVMAREEAQKQKKEIKGIYLNLGRAHPAYDAIADLPARMRPPYAWYIRVADSIAFINHVAPALEANLARSAFAGHSGEIKINEYRGGMRLILEQGRVRAETWQPLDHETDAGFPPRVFWQMLFGRHTLAELREVLPDVWAKDDAWLLLDALLPKQNSFVVAV